MCQSGTNPSEHSLMGVANIAVTLQAMASCSHPVDIKFFCMGWGLALRLAVANFSPTWFRLHGLNWRLPPCPARLGGANLRAALLRYTLRREATESRRHASRVGAMPSLRKEPRMPNVNANGIRIEYDEFGDRASPPLLLIMGLGSQMVRWDVELCRQLVGRGFRVIRFDNRDVGLSSKFHEQCPHPGALLVSVLRGESVTPPYTLDDMAGDAAALLEEMGVPAAHVVGASMGGMIAQLLAIRYPDKVLTLTSIMSTTGNRDLPQGDPNVLALLVRPVPTEREAALERAMDIWRALAGPAFPFDEARNQALVELCYDRDSDLTGTARQMLAIMTAGSRKDQLRSVTMPALVIHGDADPLVPIAAGFDTAEAIPGARMLVIEGMGHELPVGSWPRIIDAVAELARSGSGSRPTPLFPRGDSRMARM